MLAGERAARCQGGLDCLESLRHRLGASRSGAPGELARRHVPPVRSGLPHASRLHPAMRRKPVGEIAHLIGDDMATGKNEVLEPARLIRDV